MSEMYEKLKTLLKELFQLDQPDLDFGFYRVMHAKSVEVTQFLDKDLLPQVKDAFAEYKAADRSEIEGELAKVIASVEAAGLKPDDSPKVRELRARLADEAVDLGALEAEVYDHLYSFFRRYYSEGDFLSKRVYKPGVYAIPYEGEEVKLHWANADQYYIKTSEYLRDYAFRLKPEDDEHPMRVHFRLADVAEGEHGSVKEQAGKERRFKLSADSPASIEDGELVVRFTYQPDAAKQKELNAAAEGMILSIGDPALSAWISALAAKHVRADGTVSDSTRLRVHLDRFTARNTFDYFIHKDLGSFLRRELDFYIKNEVMHLDDVESESAPRVEQYLSKIKVIRRIAGKIIEFLRQLEDFQRKLWLKKKFVVETVYLIALGAIPEEFYEEIAANSVQRDEWVRLHGFGDPQAAQSLLAPRTLESGGQATPDFLKDHPTLLVDTAHFARDFVDRLLEQVSISDSTVDGTLVHADNFHALSLCQLKYQNTMGCIYIDPPFNSPSSEIPYKNDYKHASWLSLMQSRIALTRGLLGDGTYVIAIDENEQERLGLLLNETWLAPFERVCISVRHNPRGVQGRNVSHTHEYAYFLYPSDKKQYIGERALEEPDVRNLRDSGLESDRTDARNCFYPILVREGRIESIGPVPDAEVHPDTQNVKRSDGTIEVWPIDTAGREKKWRYARQSVEGILQHLSVKETKGKFEVYFAKTTGTVRTLWTESKFDASEYGTKLLQEMFGVKDLDFSYPKSLHTLSETLRVALPSWTHGQVLDYFAGSGTTGHAAISLNREDGRRRQFLLVEQGTYFDAVLVPRLKKVTFAPEWKGGKPQRFCTPEEAERSPRVFKVIQLESYDDVLNNLELRRTDQQQALLELGSSQGPDKLHEQYVLRYMLDVETRGSQSLLNVSVFTDPTAYRLKVKRPGTDESRETSVDLLETFNWLIGLTVDHIAAPRTFSASFKRDDDKDLPNDAPRRLLLDGRLKEDPEGPWWFRTVIGTTPEGRRALVIWRKRPAGESPEGVEQDNLVLDEWFKKQGYSSKDSEFAVIYVNGGNNLENLKAPDDTWKVRLIEEDFHRLMFDTDGA